MQNNRFEMLSRQLRSNIDIHKQAINFQSNPFTPETTVIKVKPGSNMVYCSGHINCDKQNPQYAHCILAQAQKTFENLEKALISSNSSKLNVIKVQIFLLDKKDFELIDMECVKWLGGQNLPLRVPILVQSLPNKSKIVIEVLAETNKQKKF